MYLPLSDTDGLFCFTEPALTCCLVRRSFLLHGSGTGCNIQEHEKERESERKREKGREREREREKEKM